MGEMVFIKISLIIIVCAVLSWIALLLRQSFIIAYIAGGLLFGTSSPSAISASSSLSSARNSTPQLCAPAY